MDQKSLNQVGAEVNALISMYEARILSIREFLTMAKNMESWLFTTSLAGLVDPNNQQRYEATVAWTPDRMDIVENRKAFLQRAMKAVAAAIVLEEEQASRDMQEVAELCKDRNGVSQLPTIQEPQHDA